MANKLKLNSIQTIARVAGLLYVLLVPLSVFGIMYASSLIVQGNVTETVNNVLFHETVFRLSIASAILVQLINIVVAILLYKILKSVDKKLAVLMVILFLISVPIALINELNQFAVLMLANGSSQLQTFVPFFFDLHKYGIFIAQIFWGLWLLPMGVLVFKSSYLPKIIGVLLIIACFGYVADSFIYFIDPNFGVTFSTFTFAGELILALWLLVRGVNVKQWRKREISV